MSTFDPNTFLDMTTTDANSTQALPVPAGEYIAMVKEIKARPWTSRQDPSKSGMALDVTWSIDDAAVKEQLGRQEVTVKQGIMLDVTETGGLDMGKGKNVSLGRLREATNLNQPGQPFGFRMLEGRPAKVKVEHRIDGDNIYAEVKQVAKLA
jgi:hypothetical protein